MPVLLLPARQAFDEAVGNLYDLRVAPGMKKGLVYLVDFL